ncbi:hypothetical protein OZX62_05655 [Bifidobacterium sp. ESL0690]|uniref:hypothetical protein n=1 Tax=Bifidobacterium sp. ESL0690 TaxID=2983214 RepID=UPI0023F80033|nr:hypothetical protein [Bifidobacterium sp. ESL0690]WEV45955.1 hypothetical protein OZX62_05655 [Bifidobacterium sp. ESL0690]
MAPQYVNNAQTGNTNDAERQSETSFEDLCEHYPELEDLTDMDDEQKIEVFRDVWGTLNEDLNSQQRA